MPLLLRSLVLSLVAVSSYAAVDPTLFQDLHWRLLGPFRAGRVLAVTGVPGEPEHFYFGSVNGGVWESKDAGRTWQPIFDGQPVGSIGAIAVAPSNPRVLYVGSGEADMRSDIAQGNGMYKSGDGGKTWSRIGLTDSQQIGRIVVHPTNADVVYVAALGHPYGPNAERGVFRSRDGGATWQRVLSRNNDNDTGAIDLAFEPGNPNVLYASLWQTRRTPWSVYPPSNGPGSGLFKSTDGGDHWTEIVGHGFPAKPGHIGIAVAPSSPQRVYAIVDAPEGGMYRSDDGGANWTRASSDARVWSRGWYFGGVTVEPKDADTVYSINVNVYRSTDGGKNFVPFKGAPGGDDYHQLWIDPDHPEHRILGVDQGTVVSVDGGRTWSSWFNQPTGQFYHVITDNQFPYWVYGAQQDSGAARIPSRTSTIDGITLMDFRETTAGGESDNIAPDPKDPAILYGSRVERLDTRTHQTQSIDPTLAYPGNDRRTWTLPLIFSPRDPRVLYFANQRLFRTEDGGQHWTVISPDLTRENPPVPPNLDPVTAADKAQPGPRQGVIYAIAPSRMIDHDIWAGTDDGQIWRTHNEGGDEGGHWENVTPAALTAWSKVGIIDASHFDGQTAYAAIDRHRLDDFKAYIYRTHDGGKSWQLAASGIGETVNVVREDPVRRGMLYAGTERGVYVSFDDGDHWQTLQLNLPTTSVRDIDIHGDDVVIATHGRAFWAIDNVTPLRQDVPSGDFLFKPAVTVRERPAGFTGSPMPKDEPMAPNPPFGAYIDYVIRSAAAQPVTVEILDANDALVRRYSSADVPSAMDPKRLGTAPEWFTTPSTVSAGPGMHRFIWPLHYPAPAGVTGRRSGSGAFSDGIWAPPGNYKVVLTVNGQKFTQPLTVVPDPRVHLPANAYMEQFTFAREVEQTRATVAAALTDAAAFVKRTDIPDALRRKATEVSGTITGDDFTAPPPAESSLRFIGQALSKLAGAIDGADAAPTQDARASWATLKPAADAALAAWTAVKGEAPPAK
ncbi:MAG TPA: hypothetical protein VN380_19890 [Thermoanaerobaculia bacterium]|jgi:photosystem II stability/assembly factor-like uncharacterized protein|nr:hypothetical protein [Thermoanaerobaculia bacterium]